MASKIYHPYKWHCCTGTFSQVTADYGISAYFHDADGIYVNLFVPSRAQWTRGADRIALKQPPSYPHTPTTQIEVSSDTPSRISHLSPDSCMGRCKDLALP